MVLAPTRIIRNVGKFISVIELHHKYIKLDDTGHIQLCGDSRT